MVARAKRTVREEMDVMSAHDNDEVNLDSVPTIGDIARAKQKAFLMKERFAELEKVAQPVVNFIDKYYDPMTYVVITQGKVMVLRADMGMPLEVND